ncbi:acetoin utilization protein AcuC [Nocardioides litoris]|uniref:acetoin utilization protein AcuC n=1 Tax=Nocardioides litoris TaxID=1926648 RepID=UPI001FEAC9BE|nr:acetoin utilization protein AcuC [Nocardioides litoris]
MPSCPGPASVVFDERLTSYDFGPTHPMSPVRVDLTMRLARALGVVGERLEVVTARPASYDELRAVHTADLLAAVAAGRPDERHGLGTPDDPVFAGMHEAAALVAGATVEACRQVWSGERRHSANVAGGLHHAMADRASGFCVYNDAAVGIAQLLAMGAERVAYVDVDAHHGDGVEAAFRDDPRVLTISLHESGQFLFPGTGSSDDVGGPGAEGFAVNVPLPPRTGDAGWLRAFHAVVPELLREVRPQVLVTQHGCDSHRDDPLADLALSVDAQRAAAVALHDLAHEVCDGRWVALGGGGYAVTTVVPRAWTHLLATVAGRPLDVATPLPEAWRARVEELIGEPGPERMGDREPGDEPGFTPWDQGYDPADDLDRAVHATRAAVFPYHGLDPQAW